MQRRTAARAAMASGLALIAAAAQAEIVHPGEQRGLGLTGPSVPQILKDARGAPYALPPALDCASIAEQIASLDEVLGPDVEAPAAKGAGLPDLMAGARAILPYRGVVRLLTRAESQERALVNASLVGWERRGFFKGLALSRQCPGFAPLPAAPPPARSAHSAWALRSCPRWWCR